MASGRLAGHIHLPLLRNQSAHQATANSMAAAAAATPTTFQQRRWRRSPVVLPGGALSLYPRGMAPQARPTTRNRSAAGWSHIPPVQSLAPHDQFVLRQERVLDTLNGAHALNAAERVERDGRRARGFVPPPGTLASSTVYRRHTPGGLPLGAVGRYHGIALQGAPEAWVPALWEHLARLALAHGDQPTRRAVDMLRRAVWNLADVFPAAADRDAATSFLQTNAMEGTLFSEELGRAVIPLESDEGMYWYLWALLVYVFRGTPVSALLPWRPPVVYRRGLYVMYQNGRAQVVGDVRSGPPR